MFHTITLIFSSYVSDTDLVKYIVHYRLENILHHIEEKQLSKFFENNVSKLNQFSILFYRRNMTKRNYRDGMQYALAETLFFNSIQYIRLEKTIT